MALIHCIFTVSSPAPMYFVVKEHACQAAKIDGTFSGGSLFLFTNVSHYLSLFSSVKFLRHPLRKMQAMLHIFLFSIPCLAILISLSPMSQRDEEECSPRIVRLQVVWEQDLQKHMRAGETPWLTWLLRGGDESRGGTIWKPFSRNFWAAFGSQILFPPYITLNYALRYGMLVHCKEDTEWAGSRFLL